MGLEVLLTRKHVLLRRTIKLHLLKAPRLSSFTQRWFQQKCFSSSKKIQREVLAMTGGKKTDLKDFLVPLEEESAESPVV